MKDNRLWQKPYRKLVHKVFFQILVLACLAIVVVMLIRSAGRGYIGNFITYEIAKFQQIDFEAAKVIYFNTVRSNLEYNNRQLSQGERAKYTKIALEKAYRLESLIGELFEITRYNLVEIPLRREPLNLSYMMEQIVDEAYPQLAANGKTVSPRRPNDVARRLSSDLGVKIVIIDANDLGVEVLGRSHPDEISVKFCKQVFCDNPLGQCSEQTPLCIVRRAL